MDDGEESAVERVYRQIRELAIRYQLKPNERINEVALAKQLKVSRTPLREALNRLVADGYVTFSPNYGFFRRSLDPKEIFDLYEVRKNIEAAGVALAIERAAQSDFAQIADFLDTSSADFPGRTTSDLVHLDEMFHLKVMALTQNTEMVRILQNLNGRIRFVRWIDMENGRRNVTQSEHRAVLEAARDRDTAAAVEKMGLHISRRLDQIVDAVREGFARIYVSPEISTLLSP